jgi:hypothetical protein
MVCVRKERHAIVTDTHGVIIDSFREKINPWAFMREKEQNEGNDRSKIELAMKSLQRNMPGLVRMILLLFKGADEDTKKAAKENIIERQKVLTK